MASISEEVLRSAIKDIVLWDILFNDNSLGQWASYYAGINKDQKENIQIMKKIVHKYSYGRDVRNLRMTMIEDR